jgi:hypothetical protein
LINNKFGDLSIGDVINLDADIDYSGAKIGIDPWLGENQAELLGQF